MNEQKAHQRDLPRPLFAAVALLAAIWGAWKLLH